MSSLDGAGFEWRTDANSVVGTRAVPPAQWETLDVCTFQTCFEVRGPFPYRDSTGGFLASWTPTPAPVDVIRVVANHCAIDPVQGYVCLAGPPLTAMELPEPGLLPAIGIIVLGLWLVYRFQWKPGELRRKPKRRR